MKHLITALLLIATPLALHASDNGLARRTSPYPVSDTVDRLESVLQSKGVKVFARINHSAEAQAAGLTLPPTQLLIFGNPKAGTPLMQTAPTIGLDLPMKVLVSQDDAGTVWVTWNDPNYLIERHGLPASDSNSLAAITALIDAALK